MWLEWQPAALVAACLIALVVLLRPSTRRSAVVVSAFAQEAALMFVLYAIWRLANRLSLMQVDGAIWRGQWLWDVERAWHLPSEITVQQAALDHPLVVQFANVFYAAAHVPVALVFLVWLFVRHRAEYPRLRNALALLTASCLLIQLIPVAPPRLVPDLGVLDTPLLYAQSVYGPIGTGIAAQLSAMPSMHVAWALLVGIGAVMVSSSPWRWVVLAHPAITIWAVVATGNHYWLDGIVAAVLLAAALVVGRWSPVAAMRRLGAGTGTGLANPASPRDPLETVGAGAAGAQAGASAGTPADRSD